MLWFSCYVSFTTEISFLSDLDFGAQSTLFQKFLIQPSLTVSTQRSLWEKDHSEFQSNRRKKQKQTGRIRVLFPLISLFQKGWGNAPLGVFEQLHPQTQDPDSDIELFVIQVIYLHVFPSSSRKNWDFQWTVPATSPFDQFCSLFRQQQKYKIHSCYDSSWDVTRCPGLPIVRWLSRSKCHFNN